MTEEGKIQARKIKELEDQGYYVVKLMKTNKNGIPDLIAIPKDSDVLFIEHEPYHVDVFILPRHPIKVKDFFRKTFFSILLDNITLGIAVPNLTHVKLFDHTLTAATRLAVVQLTSTIHTKNNHFKIPKILLTALHTHTPLGMNANLLVILVIVTKSLRMTLAAICTNMNDFTTLNQKSHVAAPML